VDLLQIRIGPRAPRRDQAARSFEGEPTPLGRARPIVGFRSYSTHGTNGPDPHSRYRRATEAQAPPRQRNPADASWDRGLVDTRRIGSLIGRATTVKLGGSVHRAAAMRTLGLSTDTRHRTGRVRRTMSRESVSGK
jgi:hypothetical protein